MGKVRAGLFIVALVFLSAGALRAQQAAGLQLFESETDPGVTLFAPLHDTITYLINNCGQQVHSWHSDRYPGNEARLLPNGILLRAERLTNTEIDRGGGGGGIRMYDRESNIIWDYEVNNDTIRQHHDVLQLPNGNILILAWRKHTAEAAIALGRNPENLKDGALWSEVILEVKPIYPAGGEVVWEWDSWNHHIQFFDPSKANYGDPITDPGRIDINFNSSTGVEGWIHANGIDYHQELDQIVISSRTFSEIWIIDHSTSTEEAAGDSGGIYGKGGRILFRWGNPAAYGAGGPEDQQLFNQHNPNWVMNGPGSGEEIIVFNNNNNDPEVGFYSTVLIIEPEIAEGEYQMTDGNFLPVSPSFSYQSPGFISRFISGAEVISNGNILICSGAQGHIFEINRDKELLWSYVNPVSQDGIYKRTFFPDSENEFSANTVFRAHKYERSYTGLASYDLIASVPIEGGQWYLPGSCAVTSVDIAEERRPLLYPNPASRWINIDPLMSADVEYTIFSLDGRRVMKGQAGTAHSVDVSGLPEGMYLMKVGSESQLITISEQVSR